MARTINLLHPRGEEHPRMPSFSFAHNRLRVSGRELGLGHRPVLVVTDALESVALHLHDVRIEEVLRLDHVTEEIPAAIHRAGTPMILQRAARRVEEAGHLPRPVKRFVTTALRAPTPFLRVNQVLRRIQVSSATLHRKWRRYVPTARPKELLDWILLLSAVRRKSFRATWGSVASELGVSRHTLRRAARRRTNLVLSDLDRASVEEPFDRFLRTALLTPRGA